MTIASIQIARSGETIDADATPAIVIMAAIFGFAAWQFARTFSLGVVLKADGLTLVGEVKRTVVERSDVVGVATMPRGFPSYSEVLVVDTASGPLFCGAIGSRFGIGATYLRQSTARVGAWIDGSS